MAVVISSAGPTMLNAAGPRPKVSSPLASGGAPRPMPSRNISFTPAFPTSRPLRPFPSIANSVRPVPRSGGPSSSAKKPVKMIEPPADFKNAFVLNLTQAELSRQD